MDSVLPIPKVNAANRQHYLVAVTPSPRPALAACTLSMNFAVSLTSISQFEERILFYRSTSNTGLCQRQFGGSSP